MTHRLAGALVLATIVSLSSSLAVIDVETDVDIATINGNGSTVALTKEGSAAVVTVQALSLREVSDALEATTPTDFGNASSDDDDVAFDGVRVTLAQDGLTFEIRNDQNQRLTFDIGHLAALRALFAAAATQAGL